MRNFFKRFVFSFNIIAIILLGGAYLSAYVSPKEAWMFALLGLAYPFLLLINIFFALFWLAQFKWYAVFSIGIMVLGIGFFNSSFQFKKHTIVSDKEIVISSYNVGLFGYFQSKWYVPEMIETVNGLKSDVLCIQEFLNLKGEGTSTVDSIKKACQYPYSYFQKLADGRKRGEYGMAIFSKFPIEHTALVHFDGLTGNMCMYADIRVDTGLYRFYNVHLQSFKFKKQDYQFIKDMPEDNDEKLKRSKGLLNRMKNAYIKRAEQVAEIRKNIQSTDIPYFMIGDFNDPPMSYSYHTLSKGLKDAFIENGSGMGKTYIGIMPNFRIDYILFPEAFEGLSYYTYKLSSDHSLVSAGIKLKNE